MNIAEYKEMLQQGLSEKRYAHSVSVGETAAKLAEYWHMDIEQAYTAGLLHDIGRIYSPGELLVLAKQLGLPIVEEEQLRPQLLHASVGAALLEQQWGVTDSQILEAVRLHTVAGTNMSALAKIIYLADIIEPLRGDWRGLSELRQLAYQDIDIAMVAALEYSFKYLAGKNEKKHPISDLVYKEIKNKISQKNYGGINMINEVEIKALLDLCIESAQEKKAIDIVSMELKGITTIADYFLIMSANNIRLAQALADHLEETLKAANNPPLRIEGYRDGKWILLDMGALVIHIFQIEEREYFSLEKLWADAPAVRY